MSSLRRVFKIRRQLYRLYVRVLHKTRTSRINGSRPIFDTASYKCNVTITNNLQQCKMRVGTKTCALSFEKEKTFSELYFQF